MASIGAPTPCRHVYITLAWGPSGVWDSRRRLVQKPSGHTPEMAPLICLPGPTGQKVGSPADSYTPRSAQPQWQSQALPLPAPKRPPAWAHQGPPPFPVASSPFPREQWAWLPCGIPVGSKDRNSEALHSAIFPEGLQVPEKIRMVQEQSKAGWVEISAAHSEAWAMRAPPLCSSFASSVKWGWWHPPYRRQEGLTLRTAKL